MLSYFFSRRQQVILSKTLKVGENYYLGIILTIDMIRIFIYKSAIKLLLPYQLISCTAQVVKSHCPYLHNSPSGRAALYWRGTCQWPFVSANFVGKSNLAFQSSFSCSRYPYKLNEPESTSAWRRCFWDCFSLENIRPCLATQKPSLTVFPWLSRKVKFLGQWQEPPCCRL